MFESPFEESIIKRAIKNGLVEVKTHNLRDWAIDDYGSVDDKPFGGDVGMLIRPEPVYNGLEKILNKSSFEKRDQSKTRVIMMSARGKKFNQAKAEELSKLAEDAERVTLSEIDDKFDEISVKRNVKELKTLSGQFAKAAVEAQTLKNRMTTLFEDMGNILGRYYSINEDLKLSGDVTSSDIVDTAVATGQKTNNLDPSDATEFKKEKDRLEKKIH
jgi:tRNA (guanine-N1)-methyltransferase